MAKLAEKMTSTVGFAPSIRGNLVVLAASAVTAIVLIFGSTAADIVNTWYTSNAYNHGFLIVPICLYLVWQKRADLAAVEVHPELRGLVLVTLAALAWLVGHLIGALLVQELSLVAAIQCVILTMLGRQATSKLIFPLAYLYFAVPFGQAIEPRLQANTAALAVDMLRFAGIPVFADGNLIAIPTGNFDVAEECSGLRFLIASAAVGTLFAGIMFRSWLRRAAFISLSLVLPVVANGARAFGIIWLSYMTSNQLAMGIDHIIYGWIFFALITFVILAIGVRFREDEAGTTGLDHSKSSAAPHPAGRIFLAGVMALAPLSSARLYANHLDQLPVIGAIHLVPPIPQGGWQETTGSSDPLPPHFVGADAELHSGYVSGSAQVYLHIAYFIRNRRGAQAVSSAHDFEGSKTGWQTAAAGTAPVLIGDERIAGQSIRSVRGNVGHVAWYWYWVDDRFTGDPYVAKLLETKVKLLGGQRASALIAISTGYANDPSEAERTLREFSSTLRGLATKLSDTSK